MKTKILVTESQYQRLLTQLNEQSDNMDSTLKVRSKDAPQWLSYIIGNKEDGYTIKLPQSDNIEQINQIISDGEVEAYLLKLKDMSYGRKIDARIDGATTRYWRELSKTNPKYKAAIVKLVDESGFAINKITITDTKNSVPTIETGTKDIKTPDEPLIFPVNSKGGKQFFADNEWVITKVFEDEFQKEVVNKILEKMKNVPNVKNPILNSLTIETSCSRLKNGVPKYSPGKEKYSKGISFLKLSEERNNAAKNYAIKKLSEIGVIVNNVKLSQKTDGDNKDGTSGGDFTKGDNAGDFTEFKYLRMKLDLTINGLKKGGISPVPYDKTGVTVTHIYNATLVAPDVPYKIPGFEWVSVWNPTTRTICKKNPNGDEECRPFDGKKVINGKIDKTDWSRNPKSSIYTGVGN